MDKYTIKVYVTHGYYQYHVSSSEQALAHAQAIMSSGVYRRVNDNAEVEFHTPYKVKVCGEGLDSEYKDEFKRT